jgi:annexin A7/11
VAAYQQMYGEGLEDRIKSETSGDLRTSLVEMLRAQRSESATIDPVSINRDVAAIRTAVEGWGTDEDALIRVLNNRSSAEIQAISTAYQETYGESLRSRIESETSGDLRTSLLAQLDRRDGTEQRATVVSPPTTPAGADRNAATRTAMALREAMEGVGTDEDALIRNLRGKSNAEIQEIKSAYQQMYGESLEERVRSETGGDFRNVLMGMLSGTRSEAPRADPVAATRDAAALREAMEGWGTDEDALSRVLTQRSPVQIKAIAEAYQQMYGESLRGRVESETSGDFRRSLLAVIDSAR